MTVVAIYNKYKCHGLLKRLQATFSSVRLTVFIHTSNVIHRAYNSDLYWNHTWWSAQWRALRTKITEVNLSLFIYRLFHEDFSPIMGINFIHRA